MILPETAETRNGHLIVGGCDMVEVAEKFGTPLYVFDETTLRTRARRFRNAFESRYPKVQLCYAAKAFINPWLVRLLTEEGYGLDVVSAGEMTIAARAGFPMADAHFHGNNKLPAELELGLGLGVGRIVIDNLTEIAIIERLAAARGQSVRVLLRLAPGIEAHTHEYLQTGGTYSKFGVPVVTDQAAAAVATILSCPHLQLMGFHAHIGSQIFDSRPFHDATEVILDFALQMRERHRLELLEVSPGGGWGIEYVAGDDPQSIHQIAEAIVAPLEARLRKLGGNPPVLILEPGRSLIGPAGLTLYTVGSIKRIPDATTYVAVDGGMADNIRPALYQARYEPLVANKADIKDELQRVTVAGKYCESGDLLVEDVDLPQMEAGDVIAVPATGAYCIPMASNYNVSLRPPIVAVRDGRATLVRRRETYEDLMSCEVA